MSIAWYILQTCSGFENKVKEMLLEQLKNNNLEALVEEIIVPSQKVIEIRRGKKVTRDKTMFSGYVLLRGELNNKLLGIVKSIPRVLGFLGGGANGATKLKQSEVDRILRKIEDGVVPQDIRDTFELKERVTIIDGPFSTFSGVIDDIDEGRKMLKVSVSIFGRLNSVELHFNQVEKEQDE